MAALRDPGTRSLFVRRGAGRTIITTTPTQGGGVFSPKLKWTRNRIWVACVIIVVTPHPIQYGNGYKNHNTYTARDTITRRIEISYMRNINLIHSPPPPYTIEGL